MENSSSVESANKFAFMPRIVKEVSQKIQFISITAFSLKSSGFSEECDIINQTY